MSRNDSSHRAYAGHGRGAARPTMVMPRLTHEQMFAILCESGVPANEARRWVEHEARLARDAADQPS